MTWEMYISTWLSVLARQQAVLTLTLSSSPTTPLMFFQAPRS